MENNYPPQINNHLVLAILTTLFCCMPLGAVSIAYATQVNSALMMGNYEVAKMASDKARFWGILTICIGISVWILYAIFYALLLVPTLATQ